jgi:hypothetical protein
MFAVRLVLGVVAASTILSGAIWCGRYAPWVTKPQSARELALVRRQKEYDEMADLRAGRKPKNSVGIATAPDVDPRPALAEQPPFPKVAIEERVYRFGTMEVGEEKTHTFRVENRGQGELLIGRGPTECKCTVSRLANGSIPPGGSADVVVTWKPVDFEEAFKKTAMIYTSDPEAPEIDFAVVGRVVPKVQVLPLAWNAGEITEDRAGTVVGRVGSPLDAKLKIATVEASNPHLKVVYKPMPKADLDRARWSAGYEFTATVDKEIPWGKFRSQVRIRTTTEADRPIDVDVDATRTGTIRFLPPISVVGNGIWSSNRTLLNLGVFGHEQGRKVIVPALVSAMPGEFQLMKVESEVGFLKITMEPDAGSGDSERRGVRFVIEIPPGSPPVAHPTFAPVHVKLKTNHPHLREIGFDLAIVSQ